MFFILAVYFYVFILSYINKIKKNEKKNLIKVFEANVFSEILHNVGRNFLLRLALSFFDVVQSYYSWLLVYPSVKKNNILLLLFY